MSEFLSELEVTPLPDGSNWRVNREFQYQSDLAGLITVPARFVTDFASIPKVLQNILPAWQTYGAASIIHDFMYWKNVNKAAADQVLLEAMELLGVDDDVADKIYRAVVLFGHAAWERNAELRANGYSRMAGAGSNFPYAAIPDLPEEP